MPFGRDIFGQQAAIDNAAVDEGLEHREDVAVHLRLVGDERAGRMKDARIDLPPRARLEPEGAREIQNAVITLVPVCETPPHVVFGGARLESHEGVGKVIVDLVVLRRKVIRFGLALLPDQRREVVALVHVMRNRAEIVEELAQQIPAAFALHHRRANQEISGFVDKRFQQNAFAIAGAHVAQPLVFGRSRAIRCVCRRREPPFVDAAAVPAERVEIVRVQLEAAAGNHEGTWHPAGFQPENAGACIDGVLAFGSIRHRIGGHGGLDSFRKKIRISPTRRFGSASLRGPLLLRHGKRATTGTISDVRERLPGPPRRYR